MPEKVSAVQDYDQMFQEDPENSGEMGESNLSEPDFLKTVSDLDIIEQFDHLAKDESGERKMQEFIKEFNDRQDRESGVEQKIEGIIEEESEGHTSNEDEIHDEKNLTDEDPYQDVRVTPQASIIIPSNTDNVYSTPF